MVFGHSTRLSYQGKAVLGHRDVPQYWLGVSVVRRNKRVHDIVDDMIEKVIVKYILTCFNNPFLIV